LNQVYLVLKVFPELLTASTRAQALPLVLPGWKKRIWISFYIEGECGMRTSDNFKSNYVTKAIPKVKEGPLIRLPIKKMYCNKCQRLVKGQIQSTNNTAQITCPRCGQNLCHWDTTSWRSDKNE
jgi:RNase P subunit RPR2